MRSGATLGGTGIIGGDVALDDGAVLAPGRSPGTLTIDGGLVLAPGAQLDYQFGEADVVGGPFNDLTIVGGDLTLDGVINVTASPGRSFDPGIYRVISYAGALTNNGLAIGAIPAGDYFVQTSIANQVNLINETGLTLNFWDGSAGGRNDGVVAGGDGLWQNLTGNDNWTAANGMPNAPFKDSAFAIFAATPGAVTVDNSLGPVNVAGMQFATSGYVIGGDALNLVGGDSVIRVGDNSSLGADYIATIDAALTGESRLIKTDLGALILNGANSFTGGVAINGGALQISSDANLGAASGALGIDGGAPAQHGDPRYAAHDHARRAGRDVRTGGGHDAHAGRRRQRRRQAHQEWRGNARPGGEQRFQRRRHARPPAR